MAEVKQEYKFGGKIFILRKSSPNAVEEFMDKYNELSELEKLIDDQKSAFQPERIAELDEKIKGRKKFHVLADISKWLCVPKDGQAVELDWYEDTETAELWRPVIDFLQLQMPTMRKQ